MTTSRVSHVLVGLLALYAAGCELPANQGKRGTPTSEAERTDEVATTPSSDPETPDEVPATTARAPLTTAPSVSPIQTREDWKIAPKKDDASTAAEVDTRTLEGTVRAIDAQRRLISINIRGQKPQTFPVDPKAPIENLADAAHALKGGLAAIRPGTAVLLVIYRNKSDREVVSLIRVKGMTK
jgi:hypothetical protein